MRLDQYDTMPSGLQEYLSYYGWHFNKKLCEFATSKLLSRMGNTKVVPYTKEAVEQLLKNHGITIQKAQGYDCVYVANMAKASYLGSSLQDETRIAKFVKDYIDDQNGYEGIVMTRFFADIIGKGIVVDWEDMI